MPRLFTALELPPNISTSLSMLRGGLPGARWIDSENYHITLRFIGDVDERTANEVADALRWIDRPAFDLTIDRLGFFANRYPKAVWAGIANSPELLDLQSENERLMQRIGLQPERRKFTPHVTLARLKGAREPDVATYLAIRGDFRTPKFSVGHFSLLSARASRGGGPYIVEETYPLSIYSADLYESEASSFDQQGL